MKVKIKKWNKKMIIIIDSPIKIELLYLLNFIK